MTDDRDLIRDTLAASGLSREDLADALKTSVPSVGRLLRGERQLKAAERDAAFAFLSIAGEDISNKVRELPIIGMIAAGNWTEAVTQPLGQIWTAAGGKNSFALQVDGDSMDQIAAPGALIVVDPDDRDLIDGKAYAVMNDAGEATFKRFKINPARLEPASSNRTHQTIVIGRDGFRIVGRAVRVIADL